MKRYAALLLLTAAACALVFGYLPGKLAPDVPETSTVTTFRKTVYDTVICQGKLVPAREQLVSTGSAARVTAVYVSEGQAVCAGDRLFDYVLEEVSDSARAVTAALPEELIQYAESVSGELDDAGLLAAAEYCALTGELPDYFKDFYMPEQTEHVSTGKTCTAVAAIDGTVEAITCAPGDTLSGLFTAAKISDTSELTAEINIPESYAFRVSEGQHVNITGSSFRGRVVAATLGSVGRRAVTTGGLLTASETYVSAVAILSDSSGLIPGLTVRATVFSTDYPDAVLIPHSAVSVDAGGEHVWVIIDGFARRLGIDIVFECDEGVIAAQSVPEGCILASDPPATFSDGCPVAARAVS